MTESTKTAAPVFDVLMAGIRTRQSVIFDRNKWRQSSDGLVTIEYRVGASGDGQKYYCFIAPDWLAHGLDGSPLDDDRVLFDGVFAKDRDTGEAIREAVAAHCPYGFFAVERFEGKHDLKLIYQHRHGQQIKAGGWQDKNPGIAHLDLVDVNGQTVDVLAVNRGFAYVQMAGVNAVKPDGNVHMLRATKVKLADVKRGGISAGVLTRAAYIKHAEHWWAVSERIRHSRRPPRGVIEERIKDARSEMQRHHPDRGGDPEQFIQAKRQYESLKAMRPLEAA